jgi:Flp pilus assembly protein TadG
VIQFARSKLRMLVRETSGAEIAEAAAVLPIMFMIIVGIFWFGQAFSIYGTITRAAQEGARAGAAPYCTTCGIAATPDTAAYNAAESALVAAKLDASNARYPSPLPTLYACSTPTNSGGGSVGCDSSASGNVCVRSEIQLPNTTGTTGAAAGVTNVCGISVELQYPFQFWLPFTPLNKQKIWMTAAAQVRMENQ